MLTVNGEVVGVLARGAALLQLGGSGLVFGNGVGAEEGVHVGLVLARHDKRIDVLPHELVMGNHSVGIGGAHGRKNGNGDAQHRE